MPKNASEDCKKYDGVISCIFQTIYDIFLKRSKCPKLHPINIDDDPVPNFIREAVSLNNETFKFDMLSKPQELHMHVDGGLLETRNKRRIVIDKYKEELRILDEDLNKSSYAIRIHDNITNISIYLQWADKLLDKLYLSHCDSILFDVEKGMIELRRLYQPEQVNTVNVEDSGSLIKIAAEAAKITTDDILDEDFPDFFPCRIRGSNMLDIKYLIIREQEERLDKPITSIKRYTHILTFWEYKYGIIKMNHDMRGLFDYPEGKWKKRYKFSLQHPDMGSLNIGVFNDPGNKHQYFIGNSKFNFSRFTHCLIAGAKIRLEKIDDERYQIVFSQESRRIVRVLEYDEVQQRFVIGNKEVFFDVDDLQVLSETRFANLEGLQWIDIHNKMTAAKAIREIFKRLGMLRNSIYICDIDTIFTAIQIFKPFSKNYLLYLLKGGDYDCFYYRSTDDKYIYDPQKHGRITKREERRKKIQTVQNRNWLSSLLNKIVMLNQMMNYVREEIRRVYGQ